MAKKKASCNSYSKGFKVESIHLMEESKQPASEIA